VLSNIDVFCNPVTSPAVLPLPQQDAPCYALVLPLAERGSLSDMLHRDRGAVSTQLPVELVLCYCYDLASALDYIHSQLAMLHRDVKPANVVAEQSGRAVLIDFDRACPQDEKPGHNRRKGPSGGRHKDCLSLPSPCPRIPLFWRRTCVRKKLHARTLMTLRPPAYALWYIPYLNIKYIRTHSHARTLRQIW